MVGDNTDRNIVLCIVTVGLTRNFANLVDNLADGINLKHIVNALHNASKTLKTHTCIYILLGKLGVVAVSVVVKLRKYVVPNFHKSVAIASGLTVGRAASVLESSVEINFRAGTARA